MYYPSMNQYRQLPGRIMTVTGNASLSVEPDLVRIQLEVMTESEQLQQAQQENANKMNQVIQALLHLGIPKENIQTTAYNIDTMYDHIDGKQQFRGYRVSNMITVEMNDISQTGNVVDIAVKNGINHVSNIQFSLKDKLIVYEQALSAALKNAIAKAQTIAETLNINLDPTPTKITERTSESPSAFKTFTVMGSGGSTPIEPGQIIVSATVDTQFTY